MHKLLTVSMALGMFVVVLPNPGLTADKSTLTNTPKAAAPGTTTGGTAARPGPQGPTALPPRVVYGTTAIPAQIDVSCSDGNKYTISTGTGGGSCTVVTSNGSHVDGGYCGDTKGNGSSVFCGIGCTGATGNGKCSNKQ